MSTIVRVAPWRSQRRALVSSGPRHTANEPARAIAPEVDLLEIGERADGVIGSQIDLEDRLAFLARMRQLRKAPL